MSTPALGLLSLSLSLWYHRGPSNSTFSKEHSTALLFKCLTYLTPQHKAETQEDIPVERPVTHTTERSQQSAHGLKVGLSKSKRGLPCNCMLPSCPSFCEGTYYVVVTAWGLLICSVAPWTHKRTWFSNLTSGFFVLHRLSNQKTFFPMLT